MRYPTWPVNAARGIRGAAPDTSCSQLRPTSLRSLAFTTPLVVKSPLHQPVTLSSQLARTTFRSVELTLPSRFASPGRYALRDDRFSSPASDSQTSRSTLSRLLSDVSSNKTFHDDVDACPIKTFMVDYKDRFRHEYELCFGKRPMEELYDVRSDPSQVNNLSQDSKFAAVKQQLWRQLRERLESLLPCCEPKQGRHVGRSL